MKNRVSIIGCGRTGTALAVFLDKKKFSIAGLASRTSTSAEKAALAAKQGKIYENPVNAAMAGDIIFITTPDHSIERVCNELSSWQNGKYLEGRYLYHCSGALSSSRLASAADCGGITGSLHPLQSFTPHTPIQPSPFTDINVSVEGEESAVVMGKKIINSLGANSFSIPTTAKTLYHAAAVVASNYLVTLENFAIELLRQANLSENEAYDILSPLIQGTLNNIKTRGTSKALTGPVSRGDVSIIRDHLRDIQQKSPHFLDLYKTMGAYTLELAQMTNPLGDEVVSEINALFK